MLAWDESVVDAWIANRPTGIGNRPDEDFPKNQARHLLMRLNYWYIWHVQIHRDNSLHCRDPALFKQPTQIARAKDPVHKPGAATT